MGRAEAEALRILRQNGEAYQSDLVRATGFSRGTLSEVLAGLERRKMIRRTYEGRNARIVYFGGPRRPSKKLRLGFTRAAEYPFIVPLRKRLKAEGLELEARVYENGVGVARDLSLLRIDVGIAPLVALLMLHSLDAPFQIIGPAGSGGSSVLESPKANSRRPEGMRAVCTKMSTMELLMRAAEGGHAIPEIGSLTYAANPSEIESALMSGAADVCSIWEPYATMLEARGAKRVVRYSELSDHVCCAAAAGNHLDERVLTNLSEAFAASMEDLRRDREAYTTAFAAMAGLDSSVVSSVTKEYSYPVEFSTKSVANQLHAAGLTLPSPASFQDALLHS